MELGDLAGDYPVAPQVFGRALLRDPRRRLLAAVLAPAWAVQLVQAVLVLHLWGRVVSAGCVLVAAGIVVLARRRPPRTTLTPDALVVRTSVSSQHAVPWADVTGVRVQGRWDTWSTALVRGAPPLPLPGLPRERAVLLAHAVAGTALPQPAPLAAVPEHRAALAAPDDLDMEAGFRRGPRRPRA